jgi:glycerophosphoryl diester phosphodiesterase
MILKNNPLRFGGISPTQVWNIAHRGARAFAPENTLYAFEKAAAFGCPMFEMDVHLSKDGELIVHHDDLLIRCTDVTKKFPRRHSYYLSDFTYEQLRTLDAGSWYVKEISLPAIDRQQFLQTLTDQEIQQYVSPRDREIYASGQVRLPTLRETLEFASRTAIMVNIEIKMLPRMYSGLTKRVVEMVVEMGLANHVIISSFDHEQLLEVRRLSKIIPTGVLTSDRLTKVGEYLRLLDADAYHPGCYGDYDSVGFNSVNGVLDTRSIQCARAAERGVNVWTCNDKDEIRRLIAAGVTGLITDFPNRVREVLAQCVG